MPGTGGCGCTEGPHRRRRQQLYRAPSAAAAVLAPAPFQVPAYHPLLLLLLYEPPPLLLQPQYPHTQIVEAPLPDPSSIVIAKPIARTAHNLSGTGLIGSSLQRNPCMCSGYAGLQAIPAGSSKFLWREGRGKIMTSLRLGRPTVAGYYKPIPRSKRTKHWQFALDGTRTPSH